MNLLILQALLNTLFVTSGILGVLSLGARLWKKRQIADILNVICCIVLLMALAFLFYVFSLSSRRSEDFVLLLIATIAVSLSLYLTAARVHRRRHGEDVRQSPLLTALTVLFFGMLIVSGFHASHAPMPADFPLSVASLPVWRPQSATLARLGPEATLDGYALRPPAGLIVTERPSLTRVSTGTLYKWRSAQRPDGTHAIFIIEIAHPRPGIVISPNITATAQQTATYYCNCA